MITLPNYLCVLHYAVLVMMNTLSVVKVTGQICTRDMEAKIQSCGTSSKRGEHMYLNFHRKNDVDNCICKLTSLFSGSLQISIISMPNSQSSISVTTGFGHRDNATFINFRNSPYAHIVKIGDLLYIKPCHEIEKRSYFCLLVSSQGQGEFDVSCGNRPVSPNNSVSDKTPKQHDELLPDTLWRIVSLVLISVLMCLCFVLLIIVVLLRKRQIRRTTESSKAATPMSRSIFYMINNNEDSTFSTQNEYEQLRISSLHVYNDVSLKLIPAPTSYINLSSLK
ncbi:uncharacterized protein LOC128184785 [Crassostrea angulata]|uniref:uncharacterized protein LOC128184785 n=1 Tax=Magallana angulata TaxID=2784310 RepID=UPI0022B0CA51|nr:uncharacterized protein LOC128184785 [Crassostrea angulata]